MRILTCHNSAFFRLLAHFETVSVAQVPGFLVVLGRFSSPAQVSGPVAGQDAGGDDGAALITALASAATWMGQTIANLVGLQRLEIFVMQLHDA